MLTLEKAAYTGSTMYYPCKSSVIFKIISEKRKKEKRHHLSGLPPAQGKQTGK